jgi:hypothetical protein
MSAKCCARELLMVLLLFYQFLVKVPKISLYVNNKGLEHIPSQTRRDNISVDGLDTIGKSFQIKEITFEVNCETDLCIPIVRFRQSLMNASAPECPGGVAGSIEKGEKIKLNDTFSVL